MSNAANQVFKVGKIYEARSMKDANASFYFTVIKRTEKSIWIAQCNRAVGQKGFPFEMPVKRRVVQIEDGVETCSPLGKYAFSPVLKADRFYV